MTNSVAILISTTLLLTGCASKVLKADNADQILQSKEFEQAVQVKEIPAVDANPVGLYVRLPGPEPVPAGPAASAQTSTAMTTTTTSPKTLSAHASKNASAAKVATTKKKKVIEAPQPVLPASTPAPATAQALGAIAAAQSLKHEPSMEDGQGFRGRRPLKDPYRVGEKVTLEVSYFSVVAGDMTAEVRNMVEVNGRKAYRFAGTARSTSVFAMFYAVEDWFETFVDFDTLIPQSYALHVKETKQLREVRTVFNWSTHKANYYDKKINDEKKLEEENKEWAIPDFAQNVFSAAFYLRAFDWRPGMKTSMHVAHEGKNLVMTTEFVRKEKIETPAGDLNCIVVKPTISLDGKFTPIGDVFVWMTDDDRKLIVRIESKIKIGKIVAVAKSIDWGRP